MVCVRHGEGMEKVCEGSVGVWEEWVGEWGRGEHEGETKMG